MSNEKKNAASAIGLDVGTSRIVAARQNGQGLHCEGQLNAFVHIPFSRMTENSLRKEQIPYAVEAGGILVYGNAAERFADLLDAEIRRPMRGGLLNSAEPESVRVIREIARTLTGPAGKEQKLCFTVPAAAAGAEESLAYHDATLRQVLAEAGCQVKSINEGLAVVYSELESTNYTGIGISFGGGLCNVCFAYLSMPVTSFSVPKAGDFIDSSAAAVVGERANRVRIVKEESFYLNGHFSSRLQQALTVYYDEVIRSVVAGLNEAFSSTRSLPRIGRPVPVVLSGGTSLPQGFRERFEDALRKSEFPVAISEIRMAAEPLTAAARGALIASQLDM